MAKPIQNRKRLLLSLAILYLFLGLFFTFAGCVSGEFICFFLSGILFFRSAPLLFVQLFLLGKKILYTEEGICIHAPFRRVHTIFWTEIECLMRVDLRDLSNSDSGSTSSQRTQNAEPSCYILISKSKKRICEIKENDPQFEKVQMLLETYTIPTLDLKSLLTLGGDVSQYLSALPFLTKSSCLFELHAQKTLEQFQESISLDTIQKARKRLRIFGSDLYSRRDFQLIFGWKIIFSCAGFDPCHFMARVYPFLSVYLPAPGTFVTFRDTRQRIRSLHPATSCHGRIFHLVFLCLLYILSFYVQRPAAVSVWMFLCSYSVDSFCSPSVQEKGEAALAPYGFCHALRAYSRNFACASGQPHPDSYTCGHGASDCFGKGSREIRL